jgi:hypothetical protein
MPFESFAFDDSITRTEPSRARVPEGYYLMECDGMEPTAADYEKNTGVWATWRILQGPDANPGLGVGGRMRDFNLVGKKDAQFGLAQTLGALGLKPVAEALRGRAIPNYAAFQALVKQLDTRCKGKRAVARIADQPGQSRPFSGIDELFPEAEWANYRKAVMVPVGAMPVNQLAGVGAQANSVASEDIFADLDQRI